MSADQSLAARVPHFARRFCLLLLCSVLLSSPSWAALSAAPQARLQIRQTRVDVNQRFEVRVIVQGARTVSPPRFPTLDGVSVRAAGSTRTFGTAGNSVEFAFILRASQPGPLTIPALEVSADGQTLRTAPQTITIRSPELGSLDQRLRVRVICNQPVVYVGQRIRLFIEILVKPAANGGMVLPARDMSQLFDGRRSDLAIFDRVQPTDGRTIQDSSGATARYLSFVGEANWVPESPGPLKLDDLRIIWRYPTRLGRDVFGRLSVEAVESIEAEIEYSPTTILPLPELGRPDNFTGAVGRFQLRTQAEPRRANVGDPIDLRLELRGEGRFAVLPPPDLSGNAQLSTDFRVPSRVNTDEVTETRKTFSVRIRPITASATEIPPIEYPYFDPQVGEYRIARSEPIPLEITGATNAAPLVAEGLAPVEAAASSSSLEEQDVLRGIEPRVERVLRDASRPSTSILATTLLAPPIVYLLAWMAMIVSHRSAAPSRASGALRRARAALNAARNADSTAQAAAVSAALTQYVADKRDAPPARSLGAAVADALVESGLPTDLVSRCRTLAETCEHAMFAPSGTSDSAAKSQLAKSKLVDEASSILAELERSWK